MDLYLVEYLDHTIVGIFSSIVDAERVVEGAKNPDDYQITPLRLNEVVLPSFYSK